MILMLDNYDSFTYNLVQYLGELGAEVEVVRNDDVTVEQIRQRAPSHIVVSPGPCTPNEAGVSMDVIRAFAGEIPLFGVCLGHQAIAQVYGGRIVRADHVMHGKTSPIYHANLGVFDGLANPLIATRYHSLIAERSSLPAALEETAWTVDAGGNRHEIMGLRHKTLPIEGVQFHPESILSDHGHAMLKAFIDR